MTEMIALLPASYWIPS